MKGGSSAFGFTIIETMIVLAVSSVLVLFAIYVVQGQTSKTEFTQTINEAQSEIQQAIGYAADGYYPDAKDFSCSTPTPGSPTITSPAANSQGTNEGCAVLGNALQFNVNGDGSTYNIYTIVGRQCVNGVTTSAICTSPSTYGEGVASPTYLTDADPIALAPGTTSYSGFTTNDISSETLSFGLTAAAMYYNNNPANSVSLVSFLANPNALGINSASGTQAGTEPLSIYVVQGGGPSLTATTSAVDMAQTIDSSGFLQVNSMSICFNSGTTGESGLITIGGTNSNGINGSTESAQLTRFSSLNCV